MLTKQYKIIFQDDQNFPLRVNYQPQVVTALHVHQFVEIVIILSGSGMHETKFSKLAIGSGDVLVIPKDGYHRYSQVTDLKLMNLLFDSDKLPIPLIDLYKLPGFHALFSSKNDSFNKNNLYPKFHLQGKEFEKIKLTLAEMRTENSQMLPGYRCCLMGHFMVLLSDLSRLYTDNLSKINEPSFKIGHAISMMNTNYGENIQLADLVKHSGMARSTFMRKFHKTVGLTPINYLLQIRIKEACKLLQQSNMNISEIAYKVGFNDSNYFTRQFCTIIGLSPRKFRKKTIAEND